MWYKLFLLLELGKVCLGLVGLVVVCFIVVVAVTKYLRLGKIYRKEGIFGPQCESSKSLLSSVRAFPTQNNMVDGIMLEACMHARGKSHRETESHRDQEARHTLF